MTEVRRLGGLQGAELNEAKVLLATEATRLAHGDGAAERAARTAAGLFGGGQSDDGLATLVVDPVRVSAGLTLAELAVEGGLTPSRSAARRLAAGGGLRLDGIQVTNADLPLPSTAGEWRLAAGRKQHLRIVVSA